MKAALILAAVILTLVGNTTLAADLSKAEKILLKAAEKGDLLKAQQALSDGANVNCQDKNSWTPLHLATVKRNAEIAKLLIDHGANPNSREKKFDATPLMSAAAVGDCFILDLLIRAGADVNAKTKVNTTALMSAAALGQINAVRLLVEKGADIEVADDKGKTALMYSEKGTGFLTDSAIDYLHPETKYGRAEVTAYLRNAMSRKVASEHPSLDLLSKVDFKILDTVGDLTTVTWRLILRSGLHDRINVIAKIQFIDADGFALSECLEPSIELQKNQEKTITGTTLIKSSLALKISKVTASFSRIE